jgi:PilZ domain
MLATAQLHQKQNQIPFGRLVNSGYTQAHAEQDTYRLLRRHNRFRTNIRAVLTHGDRFQTTILKDISRGGACLYGAYGAMPGDEISIDLCSGRRLDAVVRWWIYGHCGVAFTVELDGDDQLLSSARAEPRSQPRSNGHAGRTVSYGLRK